MSVLSSLIKSRNDRVATAIPAIPATDSRVEGGAVAKIATVAVANSEERKNSTLPKVSPGGTGEMNPCLTPTSRWTAGPSWRDSCEGETARPTARICCPKIRQP
jgi:hypothetical protein